MLNIDSIFNIYSVILLIGTFQGLLYGVIFLWRGIRQKRLSDFMMSALLLLLCVQIIPFLWSLEGSSLFWKELLFFPMGIGLIIGPVLYFYLKTQTNTEFRFQKKDVLHLLPYLLYLLYHLSVFVQGNAFIQHWIATVHLPFYIPKVFGGMSLISNYFYLFLAVKYYYEYQNWLETELSDTEDLSLTWYRNYLFMAIAGITLSWSFYLLDYLGFNLTYTQNWWEYVFISIIIYVVSIHAYNQPQVIYLKFKPENIEPVDKQVIPEKELERFKQKTIQLLEEEKAYLNPKLTLSEMAELLGINNNLLSQVINKGFNKNFNQLINDYRIEEFKKASQNPSNSHLSLLAIALDCGFNSKATFNRAFKRSAGISPKEFLENN